jgi:hypothetical protein
MRWRLGSEWVVLVCRYATSIAANKILERNVAEQVRRSMTDEEVAAAQHVMLPDTDKGRFSIMACRAWEALALWFTPRKIGSLV